MATQFIEDPETKEKIPFEWNKPTPPTSEDINALFKSVKSRPVIKQAPPRGNPPVEGTVTKGTPPPWWVPWAKTGLEIGGFWKGGPGGYALAKQAGKLLPGTEPSRIPTEPEMISARMEAEKEPTAPWAPGMTRQMYEKVLGKPVSKEEWAEGFQPFRPESTLGKINKFLQPFSEVAGEVGKDIGEGYMMGKAGDIVGKAITKAPLYAKGRTPGAEELMRIAKKEDLYLPAADVTGNVSQSALAGALQKVPQSGSIIQQKEGEIPLKKFAAYTERTLGKLGGRVEPEEAGKIAKKTIYKKGTSEMEGQIGAIGGRQTRELSGQSTQEGIGIARETNKQAGGTLFSQGKDLAPSVDMGFENTLNKLDEIPLSNHYQSMPEQHKAHVDRVIALVRKKITPPEAGPEGMVNVGRQRIQLGRLGERAQQELGEGAAEEFQLPNYFESEGLRKTIRDIANSVGVKGTAAEGPLNQIWKTLDTDMGASAQRSGSEAHNAYLNARSFWAEDVVGQFGTKKSPISILRKIENAKPSQVLDIVTGAPPEELRKLKEVLPPEHLDSLARGILTDIAEAGSTKSASGDLITNGPQIAKRINKIGEERLKTILSPDQNRYLRDLSTRKATEGTLFEIATGSPTDAFKKLQYAKPEEIDMIKKNLNPEEFLQYRQGLITHIFEKNSKISPTTGERIYDGPAIAKDFFGKSGLGEVKVKRLTTPEEMEFLKEYTKAGAAYGNAWRIAGNPSGTAHALYVLHLIGQAGAGAGALLDPKRQKEWLGGGTAANLGAFMTPYVLARLMTSSLGRKYLIGGFPGLERAATKAIPYGVIATRGILSGPDQKEEEKQPIRGGGALPFESRQFGGPVSPSPDINGEIGFASEAMEKGVSIDRVRKMFRERTGQEL